VRAGAPHDGHVVIHARTIAQRRSRPRASGRSPQESARSPPYPSRRNGRSCWPPRWTARRKGEVHESS
jgi:hypothetical protein